MRSFTPLRLLCTDRKHNRLVHMGLDGHVIGVFAENLRLPSALSIHGDELAVAELEGRVTVLDRNIAKLRDRHDSYPRWIKMSELVPQVIRNPAYDLRRFAAVQAAAHDEGEWVGVQQVVRRREAGAEPGREPAVFGNSLNDCRDRGVLEQPVIL